MNIIMCESSDIDVLYDEWALAFEGTTLDDENLKWLIRWIENHNCKMIREDFYVITGKLMNEKYNLTGDNAYPNDCNILCIKQSDLTNVDGIIIPRFEIGGRWITDVINNNLAREERD